MWTSFGNDPLAVPHVLPTARRDFHLSSETSSAHGKAFDLPNRLHIVVFSTGLETPVFGLEKKPGPPRMCRICRTFRKSYPFGAHAATNPRKSTLNILAFLDFW